MNHETVKIGAYFASLRYSARGWWNLSIDKLKYQDSEDFYSRDNTGDKKFTENDIEQAKHRILDRARKHVKRAK